MQSKTTAMMLILIAYSFLPVSMAAGVDDWNDIPAYSQSYGSYSGSSTAGYFFLFLIILVACFIAYGAIKKKIAIAVIGTVIAAILIFIFLASALFSSSAGAMYSLSSMSNSESLGYSVGGAKDINNFRENVRNNYLPLQTDITYEGLFYDYYFDTGEKQQCDKMFCPSYSYAISKDPFSNNDDYYLSIGLNSGIKESDFHRKKLNLVVVLDVSGSMSSTFYSYYYDQFKTGLVNETEDRTKSKMQVARESVAAMLNHLKPDDRFGMVVFDDNAYLVKPVRLVGETDMDRIKSHILELEPRGGTNMEAGLNDATPLFDNYKTSDQSEYENRIIFLTDAMPNTWDTGPKSLLGITKKNSENKIYTTFIGIGVDFNTELIEKITKIRGANYYSVHSGSEFKNRMDDEFEFMVTPMVFNLLLKLEAEGFEIEKVYGSPEADEATGTIMKVNTLFPSKTTASGTRGGIVLLKLKRISDMNSFRISVAYEDRSGRPGGDSSSFSIHDAAPDYFDNTGIRKGILLSRYADLAKNWIIDEREAQGPQNRTFEIRITTRTGIVVPVNVTLGEYERLSFPLQVNPAYKQLFAQFRNYFEKEMNAIGDMTLNKELEVLDKLVNL